MELLMLTMKTDRDGMRIVIDVRRDASAEGYLE